MRGRRPARSGTPWRPPLARSRGLVLIYTLWIIAAASILLALYAKSALQPARLGAQQLQSAIALPEVLNVLDFVLAHTLPQEREIDPRFITFREQVQSAAAQDGRSLVRELKQILGQLGMELDVADDVQNGIAVIDDSASGERQAADAPTKVRQGRLFRVGKAAQTLRLGDASYQVRLHPANARPNLNTMAVEPMVRYLVYLGLAAEPAARLAAAIQDWRDYDDFLSDHGAESASYPLQRGPRNAPLQSWDELTYLLGADADLVAFLRPHFTLHGAGGLVMADYLSVDALAAITDLEPWEIGIALENQALPAAEQVGLNELLGDAEAQRFRRSVGWDADSRVLLVDVIGAQLKVSAVFDTADQQLRDWYLWH
jgi:type II secretory pathway component PulK